MSNISKIDKLIKICDWAAHEGELVIYNATLDSLKSHEEYQERQYEPRRRASCSILNQVNFTAHLKLSDFEVILKDLNELENEVADVALESFTKQNWFVKKRDTVLQMATCILLSHLGYVLDDDEELSSLNSKHSAFAAKAKLFATKNDAGYKRKVVSLFEKQIVKGIYAVDNTSVPRDEFKMDLDSFVSTLMAPNPNKKEISYPQRISELLKHRSQEVYKENLRAFIQELQPFIFNPQTLFTSSASTSRQNSPNKSTHRSPVPQTSVNHSSATPSSVSRRIEPVDDNEHTVGKEEMNVQNEEEEQSSVENVVTTGTKQTQKSPLRVRATKYTGRLSINSSAAKEARDREMQQQSTETERYSSPGRTIVATTSTRPSSKRDSRPRPKSPDSDVSFDNEEDGDGSGEYDPFGRLTNSQAKPKRATTSTGTSAAKKRVAQEALMDDGEGDSEVEPDNSDHIEEHPSAHKRTAREPMSAVERLGQAIANVPKLTVFPAQIDGSSGASRVHRVARKVPGVRHNWNKAEEAELIRAVNDYGQGQWAAILDDPKYKFHDMRTNVHLKDKWRNMEKAGTV